jgi:hypothetical protein
MPNNLSKKSKNSLPGKNFPFKSTIAFLLDSSKMGYPWSLLSTQIFVEFWRLGRSSLEFEKKERSFCPQRTDGHRLSVRAADCVSCAHRSRATRPHRVPPTSPPHPAPSPHLPLLRHSRSSLPPLLSSPPKPWRRKSSPPPNPPPPLPEFVGGSLEDVANELPHHLLRIFLARDQG